MTLERRRLVRVPASSGNLGPGFDVMGAALSMYLELEVQETGSFSVRSALELPLDRTNLVVRAFELLHPADSFQFTISSQIPLCGGLGSSAAAIVAGLLAADHIFELDADVRSLATELEGHADNVAAALEGGFVICSDRQVQRLDPPMGLEAVLVLPNERVETRTSREVLPSDVPLEDASFNAAQVAMLVLGLARSDWELIGLGLQDKLHQPYRAGLYPRSAELLERAAQFGALGATISGAGPSVMFWSHYDQTGVLLDRLSAEVQDWATVTRAVFETQGAYVRGL